MDGQKFCLKWDGFQGSVTSLFDQLRLGQELVDITLCCEGQQVRAHRLVLSACSPYFRDLLKNNPCQHMLLFLKDTSPADLRAIIEFMYKGSVNVAQSQLASFIKTAEMLQIRGLSGDDEKPPPTPPPPPRPMRSGATGSPQAAKRRRLSGSEPAQQRQHQQPLLQEREQEQEPPPLKLEPEELATADASLDATLGYVAEFEGGYGLPERPPADALPAAGPSQRLSEDGSTPAPASGLYPCDVCGKVYRHTTSLAHHRKLHQGLTTCRICGTSASNVYNLRQHLKKIHGASVEHVRRLTDVQRTCGD
ncbi:protein tramtrack, beta isoform-like [Pollicipes pollicipes]|uniref:protein tramtrack, beta isoform-like n=1 Tax=Pollicipes pollicipes TaxID=41117 RepID=UPI001884A3F0|nr:protein tramtrack, beta isoform-like [Pollicipes pollicipes]